MNYCDRAVSCSQPLILWPLPLHEPSPPVAWTMPVLPAAILDGHGLPVVPEPSSGFANVLRSSSLPLAVLLRRSPARLQPPRPIRIRTSATCLSSYGPAFALPASGQRWRDVFGLLVWFSKFATDALAVHP